MKHYNIAKKVEVNPFDGVTMVKLVDHTLGKERLQAYLDSKSKTVETRKIDDAWTILYNIEILDFTTIVDWFSPARGKFQFGNTWIQFRIEEDLMICW